MVAVLLYEVDGFCGERVGDVFIHPEGRLATLHVADAADAVDDSHVMPVAGLHLQKFGVILAGWFVREDAFVAYSNWVGRVEIDDAMVLNEDARDAIRRSGNDEGMVEPNLQRSGFDL
jgi:hypothetical protein